MSESSLHPVKGKTLADCTIVIPTYNERENIALLLPQLITNPRFNIIVVDDNSPDGTGVLVAAFAEQHPQVRLHARAGKLGLGTAYIEGFQLALEHGAQYIFQMDADFSHDPHYIPALLAATEQTNDITLGSRYVAGGGTSDWGLIRRMLSRGGNTYARLILGMAAQDCTGGFRCYRRAVLESIDFSTVRSNGYSFQVELLYRAVCAAFRIGEVPIIFPDRRVGKSKLSRQIVFEAMCMVWTMRLFPERMGIIRAAQGSGQARAAEPLNSGTAEPRNAALS